MTCATAHKPQPFPEASWKDCVNVLRALAMDAVEAAQSGHPGMPMGMADVAAVLFSEYLTFDVTKPDWPDRDRFILSAGHGSMLQYALAHLCGYAPMTMDEIKKFRQLGSKTPGHPERDISIGVETTTGPLGQGISNGVGFALAERLLHARFGNDLVDHRTFVMASDGDLMEGISHEAASLAGHLKLNKLVVLWDDNGISIDGATSLSWSDDTLARFAACGWHTLRADGHDAADIRRALDDALQAEKPVIISCKTTIGFGAPRKGGTKDCHGAPLGADEIKATREKLGWPHAPFVVPDDVLAWWRAAGARGASARMAWEKRLHAADVAQQSEFHRIMQGQLPASLSDEMAALKEKFLADQPQKATRQLSGMVLEKLTAIAPEIIGGSADLSGSNNTQVKATGIVKRGDFSGRYIHYGVREHGMSAAMNGMALHGGLIPYSGTFLQFTDYCRPSIRLAALMKQRVIWVMTHDSIGLGEDGPTHQPVEHLSAMRAIPNLLVLRPADAVEVAEAWEISLVQKTRPSVIVLTRQNITPVRTSATENWTARGAYVVQGMRDERRDITLMATGSELGVAVAARAQLAQQGISAAVVSMPSFELFAEQPQDYRQVVLGDAPRIAIEAAVRQSWDQFLRAGDAFIGMKGFGESGPAEKLYDHFGITPESVVTTAEQLVQKS